MRAGVIVFVGTAVLASCRAAGEAKPEATASPRASILDAAAPAPVEAASRPARRDAIERGGGVGCRVVTRVGDVRLLPEGDAGAGPLLSEDSDIAGDAWITLSGDSRIVAKDPQTTRETTFRGPARARACVGHREESWVASGVFESTTGAGETPGAEEWVVTPFAVVRYGSAKLRIAVREDAATITRAGGVAFVWVPDDARPSPALTSSSDQPPWLGLGEGRVELRFAKPSKPLEAARLSVLSCASLAQRSTTLARQILAHDFGEGGAAAGRTMAEQVTTRRLARAACALSALRVRRLAPSETQRELLAAVARAEAQWSTLPPSDDGLTRP